MNREREFRGKSINGEWFYGDLLKGLSGSRYIQNLKDGLTVDKYRCPIEVIPETVGQYTGLTDKEDKDIFGKDILEVMKDYQHPDGRIIYKGKYLVSFLWGSYGIFRNVGWWDLSDFSITLTSEKGNAIREVKIIGNITDNPEKIS